MIHMESLILLGGIPFDVCLVLSGSHIAVCFHPFSQTAEPSSTVIIFLILNGFSLLPSIPPWSLFSIFLPPVSQYSKPSSTAVIFSFPLGLATFFLCSSSLSLLHSIGKSTFLSTFWPSISKYSELSSITIIFSFPLGLSNFSPCSSCLLFSNSIEKSNLSSTFWLSFSSFSMLTMFSWLKTWIYLGVNTIISPISEPSSSFLVTLPSSLSFFLAVVHMQSSYSVFFLEFFWVGLVWMFQLKLSRRSSNGRNMFLCRTRILSSVSLSGFTLYVMFSLFMFYTTTWTFSSQNDCIFSVPPLSDMYLIGTLSPCSCTCDSFLIISCLAMYFSFPWLEFCKAFW